MELTRMPLPVSMQELKGTNKQHYISDGRLSILMSRDPMDETEHIVIPEDLYRWHLSISHQFRLPTWKEMGEVKDILLPNTFMCIPHPPREHWINLNRNVLHLIELYDEGMIAHMVWEAKEITKRYGPQTPS